MNIHHPGESVPGRQPAWNPANFDRHPVDEAETRRMIEEMRDAIENITYHNSNRQRDAAEARNELGQKANELMAWERSRRETSADIDSLKLHLRELETELSGLQDEWRGLEATAASLSKTCVDMENKTVTLVNIVAAQNKEIQQQRGRWVTVMTSRIDHEFEGRRMEKLTEQLGAEHAIVARVHGELETVIRESRGQLSEVQKKYDQASRDVSTLEQLSELRVIGAEVYHMDRLLMIEEARREWAAVNEQLMYIENSMQKDQREQQELTNDINEIQKLYKTLKETETTVWS